MADGYDPADQQCQLPAGNHDVNDLYGLGHRVRPQWAWQQPASGIASFDIFTNTDGGAFTLWTTVTPAIPSAQFTGQAGHTYGFYSVATDNAGNVQSTPASAQQTIQIASGLTITSISPVSPNPRNATVATVDVTFSESIDASTLNASDVTLTQNGTNVPLSSLSFTLVSGTTYQIGGSSTFDATDGLYALTVNATDINDANEIPGTGSLSTSWLMDTTPPTSSVSSLPASTTSTTFAVSVTGSDPNGPGNSPASGVVSFDIFTNTDGGAFTLWTTVTPASPSAQFTGQAGHTYGFYSVATDNAGNVQSTPASAQQTIQIASGLTITSISPVSPNPRNATVATVDVTFSESIDLSSFVASDVTLTQNGTNVPLSSLSFTLVSGTTYQIGGLTTFDATDGLYALSVNATGINDANEIPGTGSLSTSWVMDTTPPTSSVSTLPATTTSTTFTVSVGGSDPNGPGTSPASGVASFDIFTNTDGGAFTLWTTVTPASPAAQFTGQAGQTYGFYSVATDSAGNIQPTPVSAQQTVQILSPMTVVLVAPVSPNPRNTAVSSEDVTFSLPINTGSLTSGALTLTDNGNPVAVSGVSLALVSGTTYQLTGLASLTIAEGSYTLTVNATGLQDTDGNSRHRLALSTSCQADGYDPANQQCRHAAGNDDVNDLDGLGHRVRPEWNCQQPGLRRRLLSDIFTQTPTAEPSPSGRPSRPPALQRSSPPRPATLTASTAWRPITPATFSRLRPRLSRPSRSSRR